MKMFKVKHILNFNTQFKVLRRYTANPKLKTFTQKKQFYGDIFPDKLLQKKQKTPEAMYIANEETANDINKHLEPFFNRSSCDTILEMNPGIGVFTRKLLDNEEKFKKIILMESMNFFMDNLQEMHNLYPDRVKVVNGDLVNVWKIIYQDKMDHGTRVQDLLRDIPNGDPQGDPNMILFGIVGSQAFFKHLINSVIFQNSFLSFGRAEMYFIVPPPIYLHLTCTNEIGYFHYRSTSILFKLLFEHRFIARLPRDGFLPAQVEYNPVKNSKLRKVKSINPEHLYLVRIVPRKNITDFIDLEELPQLWYFIKQNCVSRRNRVIPNLEKWIPGCGPRLIINWEKSVPSKPLYDDEDITQLPKYSSRCVTISNREFYPDMNIYTQFGDLTHSQMLTIFSLFRKWPEYKDSSFLASFENNMLKTETSAEEAVNGITEEDDDIPFEQQLEENVENASTKEMSEPSINTTKKTTKRSRQS